MSSEQPIIRPGRLAAAWLLCTACGCAGAAAWMPLYWWLGQALAHGPAVLSQAAIYGSLFAFIAAGIYCGVRISRSFLSALELEVLFRLPRDQGRS